MIAGYQHLHTLGMVAEQVARNCWLADGMALGGNDALAEQPMERALRACDEIAELAKAIRSKRSQADEA